LLYKQNTNKVIAQFNRDENGMIIEIDFCEIFQNDVLMEEEHLLETWQQNESL